MFGSVARIHRLIAQMPGNRLSACIVFNLRVAGLTLLALTLTSCFFSAKPIYNDNEKAAAERAVSQFHDVFNRGNAEALYDLMDKTGHDDGQRANLISDFKAILEKVGKVKSSRLVESKVFPSPGSAFTSQVKLAYEMKSEKGNWEELFCLEHHR